MCGVSCRGISLQEMLSSIVGRYLNFDVRYQNLAFLSVHSSLHLFLPGDALFDNHGGEEQNNSPCDKLTFLMGVYLQAVLIAERTM